MKYSAATGAFYVPEIHGDDIPVDAVDVSDAEYAALVLNRPVDKRVIPNDQGRPVLADHPPPTADQLKARQISDIDAELIAIDSKKTRAMTDAILTGNKTRLETLEAQASTLRTQRAALTS